MDANNYFKGKCPYCGSFIYYNQDMKATKCNYCRSLVTLEALNRSREGDSNFRGANEIDSPNAGMGYFLRYLAEEDLSYYLESPLLVIPEIDEIVEAMKLRHSDMLQTFKLEILSITLPLTKKLSYLEELGNKIAGLYSGTYDKILRDLVDKYRNIIGGIIGGREQILERLDKAIASIERLNTPREKYEDLIKRRDDLADSLESFTIIKSITDIPEVRSVRALLDHNIRLEMEASGEDIDSLYDRAINAFNEGHKSDALELFKSLKGYRDSALYINRIENVFVYNKLIEISGSYYMYDEVKNDTLDLKKLKKGENAEFNEARVGLYEIKDGKRVGKPIISDIKFLIGIYGDNLFYLKRKPGAKLDTICVTNLENKTEKPLLEVKPNTLESDMDKFVYNKDFDKVFIKRTLDVDKPGCFKKAKENTDIKAGNNFELIEINLKLQEARVCIKSLVDIEISFENSIFYSVSNIVESHTSAKKKNKDENSDEELELTSAFMVYDTETGINRAILDLESNIIDIIDSRVIYSKYTPSELNSNLYCYDLRNDTNSLIERNMYEYFTTVDNKLLYTIGNEDYQTLIVNSLDGDRHELMNDVLDIIGITSGYIYLVLGSGVNTVLMRTTIDGHHKNFICTGIKRFHKISNGILYYEDVFNNVRSVRVDGSDDKLIVEGLDDDIVVSASGLYYLRKELISTTRIKYEKVEKKLEEEPKKKHKKEKKNPDGEPLKLKKENVKDVRHNNSIYHINFDGRDMKKLVFDVVDMKDHGDDFIYYRTLSNISYAVTERKPGVTPKRFVATYKITRYFSLNKVTGEERLLLELGLPDDENTEIKKSGCLQKKKDEASSYEYDELPRVSGFKNQKSKKPGDALAKLVSEGVIKNSKEAKGALKKTNNTKAIKLSKPSVNKDGKTNLTNSPLVKLLLLIPLALTIFVIYLIYVLFNRYCKYPDSALIILGPILALVFIAYFVNVGRKKTVPFLVATNTDFNRNNNKLIRNMAIFHFLWFTGFILYLLFGEGITMNDEIYLHLAPLTIVPMIHMIIATKKSSGSIFTRGTIIMSFYALITALVAMGFSNPLMIGGYHLLANIYIGTAVIGLLPQLFRLHKDKSLIISLVVVFIVLEVITYTAPLDKALNTYLWFDLFGTWNSYY